MYRWSSRGVLHLRMSNRSFGIIIPKNLSDSFHINLRSNLQIQNIISKIYIGETIFKKLDILKY